MTLDKVQKRSPGATRWLVVAAALLALIQLSAFHTLRGDDAYITYRYAQNLARGLGPVFNPGEAIQGFTSPGHMLLAATVHTVFGHERTPGLMAAFGCIAWTAQSVAVFLLFERALGRVVAAGAALLIGLGAAGAAGYVVLETHFVSACVLASLCALERERWNLAAVSCGLAVLMRPDAGLAAALVLLTLAARLRWAAWRPWLLFALIAAPFPIFALLYYGSPLPQTALTKFHRVGFGPYLVHELALPGRGLCWSSDATWFAWAIWPALLLGCVRLWLRGHWQVPVYGAAHAAAYAYLRPFTEHTWHLYPWALVACLACFTAFAPLPGSERREARWLGGLWCGGLLAIACLRFGHDIRTASTSYWTGQRQTVYTRISDYLRSHARAADSFASVEVGTIAYYTDLYAHDLGGLVTPPGTPIDQSKLRFVVLDKLYLRLAPPSAPVFSAQTGDFFANVYEVPQR